MTRIKIKCFEVKLWDILADHGGEDWIVSRTGIFIQKVPADPYAAHGDRGTVVVSVPIQDGELLSTPWMGGIAKDLHDAGFRVIDVYPSGCGDYPSGPVIVDADDDVVGIAHALWSWSVHADCDTYTPGFTDGNGKHLFRWPPCQRGPLNRG